MAELHVNILNSVLQNLRNNIGSNFICDQITSFTGRSDAETAGKQIKTWINKQLQCFSYTEWLIDNHADFLERKGLTKDRYVLNKKRLIQEGRIQWVEWMIENHKVFNKIRL